MALSASTVWEVRTGGSDSNGGGFVTGASGTDFSQQSSAQFALTTVTTAAANAICLSASAAATMVGNIAQIISGTNFIVGFYQIISVVAGVSFTLDRTCTSAAGASGVINIGGALLSLAIVPAVVENIVYVKNDGSAFSITSATPGVSGGVLNFGVRVLIVGYQTNRSIFNSDSGPTIKLNVSSATVMNGGGASYINLTFDGNSQTGSKFTANSSDLYLNLTIKNFNTASTSNGSYFIGCLLTSNSALVASSAGLVAYCEIYGNTGTAASCFIAFNVLCYSNSGASTDGIQPIGPSFNVTSVGNGRDGIRAGANGRLYIANCYMQGNGAFGFNAAGSTICTLVNCGFFNNTSGPFSGSAPAAYNNNPITLAGDAFTNLAGNVYSLNALASQGALLRSSAVPALFPRGLTATFLDVNAARHQDPSSAGMLFIPNLEGT